MWSITLNGKTIAKHDDEQHIVGGLAHFVFGYAFGQDVVAITPVGPSISMPPTNEVEWFAIAYKYALDNAEDRNAIEADPPEGYDKMLYPGGLDVIY